MVTTIASNVVVGGGKISELVVTGDAIVHWYLDCWNINTLKIDGTTSKISYDAIDESKTS